jgi:hypothetical protein
LDNLTWKTRSAVGGFFTNQPDQIKFITGGTRGLLYFTGDGGSLNGVHAQTPKGQYLTIFESTGTTYNTKTTGLSCSPEKKHTFYCALPGKGHV